MPPTQPSKLDGWKEIAAYLGRDVTTAIRWEHERRLPVHRVPGGKRGAVYAYRNEIDHWLDGGAAVPNGDEQKTLAETAETTEAAATGQPAAAPLFERAGKGGRGRGRQLAWAVAIVVVAGVVLAVGALRGGNGALWLSSWGRNAGSAPGGIDRVEYRRSEIVVHDVAGHELWRYAFDVPIDVDAAGSGPSPRHAVVDLDRDGISELVVSVPRRVTPAAAQDELLCFSETGRVRWRLQLDDVVSFRSGTFGSPWTDGHVVAYRVAGEARIAWSQNSSPSWPSLLTVLDGSGRRISTFVHSGSIYALAAFEGSDGPVVLGGVVSNSNRSAGLFALDGRAAAGHSSEPPGSAYECLNCPSGPPLRYFLFPPSELNTAVGMPYNQVFDIRPTPEGFQVYTSEVDVMGPPREAWQYFVFSNEFELRQSSQSDSWVVHEQLERSGKLGHSVADCPLYRDPPPVRSWDPANGWRELKPAGSSLVTVGPRASSR
jgi:hypothetical protein